MGDPVSCGLASGLPWGWIWKVSKKLNGLIGVGVHIWVNYNGLNVTSVWFLNDLWWSMWFAPDWYQVCEIQMWHSDTNGICVQHGQMNIGIILRYHNVKTLSGHMMTGVLLWFSWIIVEEHMLGYQINKCIWLECIPWSAWWPLKVVQMVGKIDFAGVMGF